MPNMNHATDILRVKQIVIDEEGNVAKRFPRIDAEGQLKIRCYSRFIRRFASSRCKYRAAFWTHTSRPGSARS